MQKNSAHTYIPCVNVNQQDEAFFDISGNLSPIRISVF